MTAVAWIMLTVGIVVGIVAGMALFALFVIGAECDREREQLDSLGAEADVSHLDGELP